jgi:hypothetical protein
VRGQACRHAQGRASVVPAGEELRGTHRHLLGRIGFSQKPTVT